MSRGMQIRTTVVSPMVVLIGGILGLGLLVIALLLAPTAAAMALGVVGLGVPLILLVWSRPEMGVLALVFLTSSFIPPDLFDVRLPVGGGLDLRDLALLGMLGLLVYRGLVRKRLSIPWWPVSGPLLLFLVMVLFSGFYALVFQNVESNWALSDLRILSLYATFFLVLWTIEQPAQINRVLVGLFIVADLTVAVMLLQQLFGADNYLLAAMTGREWRVYAAGGAVRVVPAGHVLMHFMWLIAVVLVVFGGKNPRLRAVCAMQIVYLGVGQILSFTRAQWLATTLGLALIMAVLLFKYLHLLPRLLWMAVAVCLIMASLWGVGAFSALEDLPLLAGIARRVSSVFTPGETLQTDSLEWRTYENGKALEAIQQQPLLGVGLGNRYRNLTSYMGESLGYMMRGSIAAGEVSRFTRYVHNSYLSIAVKMGLPALMVFAWVCGAFLYHGWRLYRDMRDSEYQGIILAILAGFLGVLVWSYFHAHLIKVESTPVIALMMGLVGSIASLHSQGMLPAASEAG